MLLVEISKIIDVVSDQLLEILKEKIEEIVYDPFSPAVYERQGENGGFLGSWTNSSQASIYGNAVQSEIYNDPAKMNINRESFIHGSVLHGGTYHSDIRGVLAQMINEAGDLVGNIFGSTDPPAWWKSPRPYWDEFVKLLDNGKVEELIEAEFTNRGIVWIKV